MSSNIFFFRYPVRKNSRPFLLMRYTLLGIITLGFLLLGCSEGSSMEEITVEINGKTLTLEVARTPEERAEGLMNRKSLPPSHGMIFIFEREKKLSFWMKDTTIPLSIAFVGNRGVIREIHDMEPLSLDPVISTYSVRYAIEVEQGEFQRLGVVPGDRVIFPENFP